MSPCCTYKVVVPQFYFLEQSLGLITLQDPIRSGIDYFELGNNKVVYQFEYIEKTLGKHNMQPKDTIAILNLK